MTLTKTKMIFAGSLVLATLIAAAPSQAATRQVVIGMDTFAQRCADQGGIFEAASPLLTCHTETVQVDCTFFDTHGADCSWPGIDNRVAVNRLIGMGSSDSLSEHTSVVKKGGIKLPDLDIKWK